MTTLNKARLAALLAILPGVLSILEGGSVLLGFTTKPYTVLPWLVWYNVALGFGAVITGIGIGKQRSWGEHYAATIVSLHAVVLLVLAVLFAFKEQVAIVSILAMLFRTSVWIGIIVLLRRDKEEKPV